MLLTVTVAALLVSGPPVVERVIADTSVVYTHRFLSDGTTEPLVSGELRGDSNRARGLWKMSTDGTLAQLQLPLGPGEAILDSDSRDENVWLLTNRDAVLISQAGQPFRRIPLGQPDDRRFGEATELAGQPRVAPIAGGAVVARTFRKNQDSDSLVDVAVLDTQKVVLRRAIEGWAEPAASGDWAVYVATRRTADGKLTWLDHGAFASIELPGVGSVVQSLVRDSTGQIFRRVPTPGQGEWVTRLEADGTWSKVALAHSGKISTLAPARGGGAWVLVDDGATRWLGRIGAQEQWSEVPALAFSLPRVSEPMEGEVWVQPGNLGGAELLRRRDHVWTRFRLQTTVTTQTARAEKNAVQARIRRVFPWLEQKRPFNFLFFYAAFVLGLARVAFTRPPRRGPSDPMQLWIHVNRGLTAAVVAAAIAAFLIYPVLREGSDWRHGESLAPSFDFIEWFLLRVGLAGTVALFAMAAVGQRAPRAVVGYGVACFCTIVVPAFVPAANAPWPIVFLFAPVVFGEVFARVRRGRF